MTRVDISGTGIKRKRMKKVVLDFSTHTFRILEEEAIDFRKVWVRIYVSTTLEYRTFIQGVWLELKGWTVYFELFMGSLWRDSRWNAILRSTMSHLLTYGRTFFVAPLRRCRICTSFLFFIAWILLLTVSMKAEMEFPRYKVTRYSYTSAQLLWTISKIRSPTFASLCCFLLETTKHVGALNEHR